MNTTVAQPRYLAFFGRNRELFFARDKEVLLSGPAGTGKTIACLTKLFMAAERYPGMRGLIVRKTRESLTEAALVTWETKVVPDGHPCLEGPDRNHRQKYTFPNGSVIVVGGLDKAQKVMSTEYDLVYIQEAIEMFESDWAALTTRLRNGVMPYQQLIADTNPDRPTHFLMKRADDTTPLGELCDKGRTRIVYTRHEDNPAYYDQRTGRPTPAGVEYIATLDALPDVMKERLRHGRWVQAEGLVYKGWDRNVHLIDRFPVPKDWPRFLSIDFGFTNPFSCGWWARDPDGRLVLYREIYRTGRTVAQHGEKILKAVGAWDPRHRCANWDDATEPTPALVVCDHADAEGRATLEGVLLLGTVPADKAVSAGIQAVGERLLKQGDGKPRLYVMKDSLVERDEKLAAAGHPTSIVEEFDAYAWPKTTDGKVVKEVPVDLHNHAMDQMRYIVQTLATRGFVELTPQSVSVGGGLTFGGPRGARGEPADDDYDDGGDDDHGDSMFSNIFRQV